MGEGEGGGVLLGDQKLGVTKGKHMALFNLSAKPKRVWG